MAARVDQNTFTGDPRTARGLDFSDVVVDGELGDLPAWYVPTASDRRNHFGVQEWRDIDAAVRYALDAGARDVVLVGVSMGAAIGLQVADRSEHRTRLRGLILDSPVMDWRDVFVYQGGESGLPAPISRLAIWTVERRIDIDLDRYDWVTRSADLRLPVLMFAPDGDTYVPSGPAQEVATARPNLVTLVNVEEADHTRSWNVDPDRYEQSCADWLAEIDATGGSLVLQPAG